MQLPDYAEYKAGEEIVIFVHGFGVKRDSRGMYSDVAAALPEHFGYVLFDLYEVSGDVVSITPPEEQARRLRAVIDFVRADAPTAKVHLIAHSMGCPISTLAEPLEANTVLFLAPAAKFSGGTQKYFERYPGAKMVDDVLQIPRKDGTTTKIPNSFFSELKGLDAQGLMVDFAAKKPLTVIRATEDGVITDITYEQLEASDNITIVDLPADHNFLGETRQQLIEMILLMLAK